MFNNIDKFLVIFCSMPFFVVVGKLIIKPFVHYYQR